MRLRFRRPVADCGPRCQRLFFRGCTPGPGAIPDLPDPAGRAGMAAGTVTESDGTQSIIAAGGANFPQAAPGASTPEERGPKAYHQDIFKLRNGQWSKAGTLPAPLGYAAFASVGKGLAVAGGHNAEGILKDALLIKADGSVEKLPPLPRPRYGKPPSPLTETSCSSSADGTATSRKPPSIPSTCWTPLRIRPK